MRIPPYFRPLSGLAQEVGLAARNLTRNRARTLISLSAIAFGTVALLMTAGFIEWIFWATREATIQAGLGHVQISRPGFHAAGLANPGAYLLPADPPELESVRSAPGARAVDQRLVLTGLAGRGDSTLPFTGEAIDPDADKAITEGLPVEGEELSAADPTGILLGSGLAQALGARRGDPVSLIVELPGGGINGVEAHVRGVFTTGVKSFDDNALRIPIALGRTLLRVRGAHIWVVGLDATEHTQGAMAYLAAKLPRDKFEVASWLDLSDFYRKAVVLLSRQIDVVALLIGVIIVLGISNTLTMNVLERTGEIGTLMAMGTRRSGILRLFLAEGLLLGVAGGLAGLAIGFALAQIVSFFGIPMPPPPGRTSGYSARIMLTWDHAKAALLVAVISTTLASLYPAWKASRLPIVDALRHNA